MVLFIGSHGLVVVLRKETTLHDKVLCGCIEYGLETFVDLNG
jgi:hypothetical protein